MTRGEATQSKVHYKGKEDDFLVFVDDVEDFKKWQTDSTIPMANFVSTFKIFVTHKQGAQGTYDGASKQSLENEFGTSKDEEVIKKILLEGSLQTITMPGHDGHRNDSKGAMAGH